jgi:ABC-type transporter Mla subunit MlaD
LIKLRTFLLFGLLLLLLGSCKPEEKIVYITFDHSEGIGKNHQVLLNGVSVGTVLDVGITKDYKVLVSVQLLDSLDLPKDSQFEIQSQDFFTKAIYVTLGESKYFIKKGDTIQGIRRRIDVQKQIEGINSSPAFLDEIKEMLRN